MGTGSLWVCGDLVLPAVDAPFRQHRIIESTVLLAVRCTKYLHSESNLGAGALLASLSVVGKGRVC